MAQDLVARNPLVDVRTDCRHEAGCLDAKGHGRRDAHIPSALPYDLVPVGDTCCPHGDEHLVVGKWARVWKLDLRDGPTDVENSGSAHHKTPRRQSVVTAEGNSD